jgi:glycosyltransferase involved in cell wall biosynthesis
VEVGEFPYYVGPLAAARKCFAVLKAARYWARQSDLFVLRIPGFVPSLVWFFLRRYRKPFAVEVIADAEQIFRVVDHPLKRLWRLLYGTAQRRMVRGASSVLYVNGGLLKAYPAQPGQATVVISDVRLTDAVFTRPRTYTSRPNPLRLVQVGNMEQPYKGHEYLLKAIAICVKTKMSLHLVLVGDGRLRPQFERLALELGVGEFVSFRGAVPWGPRLFEVLDVADLFLLCSLTEGLPKALLEAMARGLPAIGSNVGGIPELLLPEALVPAGDERALAAKIVSLSADPAELSRHSARNYSEAMKYHHNQLSRARIEFYRRVKSSVDRRTAA